MVNVKFPEKLAWKKEIRFSFQRRESGEVLGKLLYGVWGCEVEEGGIAQENGKKKTNTQLRLSPAGH